MNTPVGDISPIVNVWFDNSSVDLGSSDVVQRQTTRGNFEGTVLPRAENDDDKHIVLKIVTGIQVTTAVQQEQINTHKGYFKWIGGILGSILGGVIIACIVILI